MRLKTRKLPVSLTSFLGLFGSLQRLLDHTS